MMVALWVWLPCAAALSFVIGHVWRYRHDGFRSHLYGPRLDRAQRFGMRAFRIGVPLLFAVRVAEALAAGPHSRPQGSLGVILLSLQLVAVPLALAGAGLLLVPPLISADIRSRVTPVDRITLPVLVATMTTGILVTFDTGSTDHRYRTAETLFTWARSLATLHPTPEVMHHAPAVYQARALVIMILIAIWPYTRLAGIFTIPALRLAGRLAAARRPRITASRRRGDAAPPARVGDRRAPAGEPTW
ncbi:MULTISPECIES: respiratory nitrate reductase subunit gamma [unclassified Nocardia]|uniref:respiratory nitrate reductase subunit gamma n=1 Tax=unclassified Nocardia TaxID=2637762 RepID=UPI0024A8C4C4|nr:MULTISPECIES: respiratory nitrate reductase subunit gamma [unclassified Nocardia]